MSAMVVFGDSLKYHWMQILLMFYLSFKRVDGLLHGGWIGAEVGVDVEAAEAGQHRARAQLVREVGLLLMLLLDTQHRRI